jgi:Holliday junction resolvase
MISTEKETQKLIIEYLKKKNIFHWRQNGGRKGHIRFTSINGIPDVIAIVNGIFVGIEVKDRLGKQNEAQEDFQKDLESAGGTYILAKTLDDVIKVIKSLA